MADFQYKPSETDPAVELRRALERLDGNFQFKSCERAL